MKLQYASTITAISLVLAFGTNSYAQDPPAVQPSPTAPDRLPPEPEAFSLTPFIGLGFSGNLENAPAAFGVALGYGLAPRLTVEGDLSFAPGGEQGVITQFDTRVWSLSGNVLYHFVPEAQDFTPYVAGGLGLLSGNADIEAVTPVVDDDTSTVLAWNFGGGVKTAMNENWGLRADLRFFNGDDFAPDHWRLYGGVIFRRLGQ